MTRKKVTVAITKNAEFFVDGTSVKPDNLDKELAKLVEKAKDKSLVVKAAQTQKAKKL
ncbi:MAG: hypothetical protein MZU91_05910 [Desulfosudis oleivorans]|nr:hypothetical protein [Desulfosudis oleivorans]